MKKILNRGRIIAVLAKFDLKMKLTTLLLIMGFFGLQANDSYSQNTKVSLHVENATVLETIDNIESTTEFRFIYKTKHVDLNRRTSLQFKDNQIESILQSLFENTNTGYKVRDRHIILRHVKKQQRDHGVNGSSSPSDIQQDPFNVSGQILDANGTPLPGANVVEKGTTNGTQSDFDGNFSIRVAGENATLVISYIGLTTKEVVVAGQPNINVTLEESAAALDEIVVVGYGTQKKSDLTGSLSSLNQEDLNPGANASVDQLMQGRAAGVNITQASSAPGGGLAIRIRGSSSINASNEPLYVIDGFPIDNSPNLSSGGVAAVSNNQSPRNPLNALNPGDIQSIEILKDASATAIYGSRGANGVVIITTKKGKQGRMSITYDAYGGNQIIAKKLDLLSTDQYISAINDLSQAQGNDVVFAPDAVSSIGNGVDWQDEIFRSALLTNHNLGISGANEKTSYYASINYYDQDGIVQNSGIKRYTGRINIESKFGERTQVGFNFNTSLIKDNNNIDGLQNNENAGPINAALLYDPTEPVFNADGSFAQSPNLTINNPVALIDGISSLNETNRTFGSAFLNYNFTDALSGKFNFGSDRQTSRRDVFNSSKTIRGAGAGGIAAVNVLERTNYLFEYTMTYDKRFNENHALTLLAGTTYQKFGTKFFSGDISGFPTDEIATNNLALGDTNTDNLNSGKEENTLLSYLGRINYNLFDKILLTGSIRADGSSRFGTNTKWGYFPSFAIGYKIEEEAFIPEAFNQLKLRASWGQTGNQEIGNLASQLTFGSGPNVVFDNIAQGSVVPRRIANPDLKWETTEQFNVGLDIGILGGRYSATIDYYTKSSKDLLFNLPLPRASGFGSILTNVGEVKNTGFEFLLNSNNIVTDNFKWSTSLNFSAIKNEVIDLGRVESIVTGDVQSVGNTSIIKTGEPLASYFGYEVTGIFQEGDDIANSAQPRAQPGFPIFADRNGDGAITPDDQTIIGSPYPDFTYGIQNSISYKDLKLDFFFQGQSGVDLINVNLIESLYPNNFRRNRLVDPILDRWTPQNTQTKWPSATDPNSYGGSKVNSLTVQDASFFRLKNVQLSYNVPVDKIDFLNSLQVYLTGQNLFTITDYIGFDPEANSFGRSNVRVDYSSYPLARTYTLGLSASF